MDLPVSFDYKNLLLAETPMMDLRAPIEFAKGAFPHAGNVPLLNNDEREQIGTCYKQQGHLAAVDLGRQLISGPVRDARIEAWQAFLEKNPHAVLYCFRGGMRSRVTQQWLYEELGLEITRVAGGYKALRRFLIDATERLSATPFVRLGGRTGVGKTLLLDHVSASIDLEGLANHKGSAFGKNVSPQPTQIEFENNLAIALLKQEQAQHNCLLLEDEGRNVGYVHIPKILVDTTQTSPIVVLEQHIEQRIQITLDAYIDGKLDAFQTEWGEQAGYDKFREDGMSNLEKIQRRLGPDRYQRGKKLLQTAFDIFTTSGSPAGFEPVIALLLTEYYDPMYDYQLKNKQEHVVFCGQQAEVLDYCQSEFGLKTA